MKHYIIVKFKEECNKNELTGPIRDLFQGVLNVPGVHTVQVKPNCVDRSNRYDLMIEIGMDPEALERYDACETHHQWKETYGELLRSKTIFDSDD